MNTTSKYLSKSDFKVAQDCPTKLYYKKHRYPSATDENEYLTLLADGGYMIGLMAQLLYPEGIEISGTTKEAIEETEQLLQLDTVTLFEAAIEVNGQLIRIDILIKNGDTFQLIEVKSKSFDSVKLGDANRAKKKYWALSEYKPYIEDVAFQKKVLSEKYPEANINSFLCLPDKAKVAEYEGMIGWFSIKNVPETKSGFRKPIAKFVGTDEDLLALRKNHILGVVNVDEWVNPLIPELAFVAEKYKESIQADEKILMPISIKCKKCEYTLTDNEHSVSGFDECWGKLSEPKPHILELGQLGNVNRRKDFKDGIDILIRQGRTKLSDIPIEAVTNADGKPYYNNRPYYQLTAKHEFMLDDFWAVVDDLLYPLHFIDFETSTMAIPYHKGMHPYENVVFQWSCHTIESKGAEPVHTEWLNTTDIYPNVEFAESLRDQLGNNGTFLTWSVYENTQLRNIAGSLDQSNSDEKSLLGWIQKVAKFEKDDSTLLLDMNDLALKYYYHPIMGGRTSIKVTLPAVLQAYRSQRITKWLEELGLFKKDDNGQVVNPYSLLQEPSPVVDGQLISVHDGSGAMKAYQDMLYGLNRNDEVIKIQYRDALRKYCRLDTLAMVIIWEHWLEMRNS